MNKFLNWGLKFHLSNILLVFIVCIGIFLRVVSSQTSPPGFNEDEAALGYNAYSIFITGRDEHGVLFPLSLESFGDWKLPVYSYVTILPIVFFGLTEFAVRFPSILSGAIGIILIYYICQKLFSRKSVSLYAAFFFAVSPWSIFFSRAAYEVNLATTIFLGGLLLFLNGLDKKKYWSVYLLAAGILFGITLFTYHAYIIFIPLFSIFLSIYIWKRLGKKIIIFLLPIVILTFVSSISSYSTGAVKFETTTIFANKDIIYNRAERFRKDTISYPLFNKIFSKYSGIPYQILQNYLSSFSPSFLFDKGGEKLRHNLEGFGNLYVFESLLLVIGFIGLFYYREKNNAIILAWLAIAPIPSSLTLDSPNSTRLFILMPLFTLVSAYGAWVLIIYLRKNIPGKIMIGVLSFLFLANVLFFLNLYFIHFPYSRAAFWRFGYKELVEVSNKYPNKNLTMQGVYDFPYIFFLFYNKYDPQKFRQEVKYCPVSYDGFKYVKQFGKYKFVQALSSEKEIPGVLYVDNQNFHTGDNIMRYPNGEPVFKYFIGK